MSPWQHKLDGNATHMSRLAEIEIDFWKPPIDVDGLYMNHS